jgi:hypothetical protein
VPKHEVVGKDVGVFVGGSFSEYDAELFRDPETIPMHQATGELLSFLILPILSIIQDNILIITRLRDGHASQSHFALL